MKFSEIARGTRADEEVELPRFDGQAEDSPAINARQRALNGIEEETALSAARKRAIAQGVDNPQAGDPLFDLALMVETIAISTLDADSPTADRKPLFDGGADQIRTWYGREAITLIYELQQDYQDRVAPTLKKITPLEFYEGILTLGGEDEAKSRRFFILSRPSLRWTFTRSMAVQQRSALLLKFPPGSSSETSSNPSKSGSEKGDVQPSTH